MITKIKKEDVQSRITENNVMVNPDGKKATQWCFESPGFLRFEQETRGKIHIEISPAANAAGPAKN